MTDADQADDLALLANTPTQFLLYNLWQATESIGVYMNDNEIVFMLFKKIKAISRGYVATEVCELVH